MDNAARPPDGQRGNAAAWSGLYQNHDQPDVRHFHLLEDASEFITGGGGGGRAVGFFSKVEAPEHTVFLTVAKQLSSEQRDKFDLELHARAKDVNGNGKVALTIEAAASGPESTAKAKAPPAKRARR